MKRVWIGLCVLSLLLAAGLGITCFMERAHRPISTDLMQASQAVLQGNWEEGLACAQAAQEKWTAHSDFTAACADHAVLEEAEGLFAQIQVYAAARDSVSFSATCAHLSRRIQAIAESHLSKWQNLL